MESDQRLLHVFTTNFTALDIAESLPMFDEGVPIEDVEKSLNAHQVIGVSRNGFVVGYRCRQVEHGNYSDACALSEEQTVESWEQFNSVIKRLKENDFVLVRAFGKVSGIVTRADFQKPPARMWLFGMVTIIEMELEKLIQRRFPNEGWTSLVSQGRLEKAQEIRDLRATKSQTASLASCLQLSDKGQIIASDPELREQAGFNSKSQGNKHIRRLESLRNLLAHSQDIVSNDWDTIVGLAESLEEILNSSDARSLE